METQIILAAILFQIANFIGDYTPLSTAWMLKAKQYGKPIFPIIMHGLVHSILFIIVASLFVKVDIVIYVGLLQLISHSIFDIMKGKITYWFPKFQNSKHSPYWILFGLDQLLHQIIIVISLVIMF